MANPVVYSGFLSKDLQAWLDNVDLPEEARMRIQNMGEDTTRHNVLYYDSWELNLDIPDTQIYSTLSGSLSSLRVIIAEVIGTGGMLVTGKDTDGTTTIDYELSAIGTELYPGRIIYMGYNVSRLEFSPHFNVDNDPCIFHVKHLVICTDTDPLYS